TSRRRHTSSKRDWSSDVCSSDLKVNVPLCGRIYDAYIQPNKGTLTFDAVTIGYSPVYKSDITVIFPEPITKTDKDVFNLKLSYTVTGGRDSLDLSNIIPLLDWQSLTHSL